MQLRRSIVHSRRRLLKSPAMRRNVRLIVAAAAVIAVGGALTWTWLRGDVSAADPTDAAQVARGRAVYAAHCAICHGANLEGQPNWQRRRPTGELPAPPHDASGHTWHHPDRVLFEITRNGPGAYAPPGYVSAMPAFGGTLSDDEIWAVLAFIKSTWPPAIQARQAEITARSR